MSRFFSAKYQNLVPYTPGEQPIERKYIKLNTNESPFPPCPDAVEAAARAAGEAQLYSDPTCRALTNKACEVFGVEKDEILFTNGSDEGLLFAFMAFCDEGAVFPDITYGFYSVFAELTNTPYRIVPLKEDFTVDVESLLSGKETVFLANPNAPTGISLPLSVIRKMAESDPERIIVVDEAYVDFGGESAVNLIHQYDNLLVVQTFSKSRSLAGARLGMVMGNRQLIADLNTIKYSTNPYNVNRMTMAAGLATLENEEYTKGNIAAIVQNREHTVTVLKSIGFETTPSDANFIFVTHPRLSGALVYEQLRQKGILVRHFDTPRLKEYNRITVGSAEEMDALCIAMKEIWEENQ